MAAEIITSFLQYVMDQKDPDYTMHLAKENEQEYITIDTDYAQGSVVVHEINEFKIVELKIVNLKNEKVAFYLHFELKDLEHAKELFKEMISSLKALKKEKKIQVLLCCTSGITTSYFTEKLNEASELLNMNFSFQAVNYSRLFATAFESDIVLLAPQISYMYEKVKGILNDQLVICVPATIFGAYDVPKLISLVARKLHEREEEEEGQKVPAEREQFRCLKKTLTIAILIENQSVRILYRTYEKGLVIRFAEVIKDKYRLSDLEDLMDVAIAREPDIETVVILTPGVYFDGCLTFRQPGIYNVDIRKMFTERYNRKFIFMNDANAMALGFYGLQNKTKNLSFYFHPLAARTSGIGNIVNGRLLTGRNNLSGEMQYVFHTIGFSDDPNVLALTPEGTLEIVTKYLVSVIANIDPELIAIYCDMVPDMQELHNSLAKIIQPEFVPELIKVTDCAEYMFAGGLMEAARYEKEGLHK